MRVATFAQRARLASLTNELQTLRLDSECPVDALLSDTRELLGTDSVGMYSVADTASGWHFERYHVHCDPSGWLRDGMLRLFTQENGTQPVLFYDLARPAPAHRNRLIEATAMIDTKIPGGWRESGLYREVLRPFGIGEARQHRILLCDGASLLAWFGAFHHGTLSVTQKRMMYALARPLRRRLRLERRLCGAPRSLTTLDAALENIGAPAFIVRASGVILSLNSEGRRLLAQCRETRRSIHDAICGRPITATIRFDATPICDNGVPSCWLVVGQRSAECVLATALARAEKRWQLTRRQAEVLAKIVRGLTNETIAADLEVSARAIELHISALFVRAGVASRAALVSATLLS